MKQIAQLTNKLVIFDLDGVLIDSRELHYHSLNDALKSIDTKYVINKDEHLSIYDGLNTTHKLKLLSELKGLPQEYHEIVWQRKQLATLELIKKFPIDNKLINIFSKIKSAGYMIAVASNSIRETVKLSLLRIGVMEYVDYYVGNQDVFNSKPFPEIYWKCMTTLYALPKDTLIIEDSHIGRQGALDSGATLLAVENSHSISWEEIEKRLQQLSSQTTTNSIPWKDSRLNVLVPMAGAGSRFAQQGYTFPKPLIEVNGKPMIQVVVENLNIEAHYIFIVQKEHYEKYNLKYMLNLIAPGCDIVQIDGITEGAACSTLLAKDYINNDSPLIIANSDQYIEWNSNECMYAFTADEIDGGIVTFKATHPKWSYALVGNDGFVSEVAEKKVISNEATVGIYYWKRGSDYIKYAKQMIDNNIRVNNEFYVCPVFNQAIADNKKIKIKPIDNMWGIGTPEDLNHFLNNFKENHR
jgi:beta-phosphoglucomutase-like phosphatase (HAD superfamily)/dTDP-glucose pyrophosphorylase